MPQRRLAALLDIYPLRGPEAMERGCRAIRPLRPPYGQPLPAAAADQAPQALKARAESLAARIGI